MHASASYPAGQVATALVKALHLYLVRSRGPAVADGWLKGINMRVDDLEDETRSMPIAALHDALVAFERVASRHEIASTWRQLTAHENLGYWMRVLRGVHSPADAFARLGVADSEYARTQRWETLEAREGYWRGRVHMAHDPALEEGGLLSLVRAAELRAVPELFGLSNATVVARGVAAPVEAALAQEYEVRWQVPRAWGWLALGTALGTALGGAMGAMSSPLLAAVGGGLLGVAGFGGGLLVHRDRRRRIETRAQSLRVDALERSLALKELHERRATGHLEGSIVAGQYRIAQRMGTGASGVIYEATRVRDGLPVAVKLLRAVAASDTVASDRLRRESEALGLSWHPNVVERIDSGVLPDGTTYLVMELLRGETLATRLRVRERLTPEELWPLATQICDALVAIHAAGVVHRDLKPSNIFLARQPDGSERAKLIDFGIARVEWEETRITHHGAPVGTPGYMSPEQEVGGVVDARSDLYALGAVLFECLVGEPPPPTPSGLWLSRPQTPAEGLNIGVWIKASKFVPPSWQAVLDSAMATAPTDRYQDARQFAQALRELGPHAAAPSATAQK